MPAPASTALFLEKASRNRGGFAARLVLILGATMLLIGCAQAEVSDTGARPAHGSPEVHAQARLLDDARTQLEQGRTGVAIESLRKLIDSHPESPLLSDARWTLAQAYEQSGDVEAALEQYRLIVEADGPPSEQGEDLTAAARERIAALEPNVTLSSGRWSGVTGVLLAPDEQSGRADVADSDIETWVRKLAGMGINALILEIGSSTMRDRRIARVNGQPVAPAAQAAGEPDQAVDPTAGVYFRTRWAVVLDDYFDQVVPLAHEQGLAVYGAVNLRRMPWLEPPSGWADWRYDVESGELQPSLALDLYNPGFQRYLNGLLGDLVDTGIDGIVFLGNDPLRPQDGLSPSARSSFQASFGSDADPAKLFAPLKAAATTGVAENKDVPNGRNGSSTATGFSPEFWRWAGWKARERLKVIDRLMQVLKQRSAALKFAIEIHPEAVDDPLSALTQYSEDLLEVKHANFHYVLTVVEENDLQGLPTASSETRRTAQEGGKTTSGSTSRISRLYEIMEGRERVWLGIGPEKGGTAPAAQPIDPAADRGHLGEEVGILYTSPGLTFP